MGEAGRLTAAERLEVLLDSGSFKTVAPEGESVVAGCGSINGRAVYVHAEDRSTSGGATSAAGARAVARVEDMARRDRAPVIGLFDSRGFESDLTIFDALRAAVESTEAAGRVLRIAVVMGHCAGPNAIMAADADFIFMVRGQASLFMTGPEIVASLSSEVLSDDELGGAAVHAESSGLADGVFDNDVEALLQIRRLVDFLPLPGDDPKRKWPTLDDPARLEPALDSLVPDEPTRGYDVRELIVKILDESDFFEIQEAHAQNLVIGLGRIDGSTVGLVANQPLVLAGALDGAACRKAARFVAFCGRFGIPIVKLIDVPGFLPGAAQEHAGLAREAAALISAFVQARAPQISVILRNAIGVAYLTMSAKRGLIYAWPTARIAPTGGEGAEPSDAVDWSGLVEARIAPHQTRARISQALAQARLHALDRRA